MDNKRRGYSRPNPKPVRFGISQRLGLVSDQVVPVWRDGVELLLEELGQERSREVHAEDLFLPSHEPTVQDIFEQQSQDTFPVSAACFPRAKIAGTQTVK